MFNVQADLNVQTSDFESQAGTSAVYNPWATHFWPLRRHRTPWKSEESENKANLKNDSGVDTSFLQC